GHVLATANHNILPPGYKHEIAYDWAPRYRYAVVMSRLEGKNKLDLSDFKSIQHEERSLPGLGLAKLVLGKVDLMDPGLEPYARLLLGWDGVMAKGSGAAALYAVWLQELQDAFWREQVPAELLDLVRGPGLPVMLQALRGDSPVWLGESGRAERDRLVR